MDELWYVQSHTSSPSLIYGLIVDIRLNSSIYEHVHLIHNINRNTKIRHSEYLLVDIKSGLVFILAEFLNCYEIMLRSMLFMECYRLENILDELIVSIFYYKNVLNNMFKIIYNYFKTFLFIKCNISIDARNITSMYIMMTHLHINMNITNFISLMKVINQYMMYLWMNG